MYSLTRFRIETEQVKSENMDFAEGVADYVKTEDLLIIETTEPKVETREDTADYESDATVNSDVILERMMSEHMKMENLNKIEANTDAAVVKTEIGDVEAKVKIETPDTYTNMVNVPLDLKQLTGEFSIKEENDVTTDAVRDGTWKEDCSPPTVSSNVKTENSTRLARINRRSTREDATKKQCPRCDVTTTKHIWLDEHIINNHADLISTINRQIYRCPNCVYKTAFQSRLVSHSKTRCDVLNAKRKACVHCKGTFKTTNALNDHILQKHPDFISSVTNKIHVCKDCEYKTTVKVCFDRHTLEHLEKRPFKCPHCVCTFKKKSVLDNHILREHPDFTSTVTRTIFECKNCTYKTTSKTYLRKHNRVKHSRSSNEQSKCPHCTVTFKSKCSLDDHLLRTHPEFCKSVTSKIHACEFCDFKTTRKDQLERHMLKHPDDEKPSVCKHCVKIFPSIRTLNDHILKKHPDFIDSITSEIYACANCTFKTALKYHIIRHMRACFVSFPHKLKKCEHCDTTFRYKDSFDEHIVKQHPEFTASVSRKIYECPVCLYKTTRSRRFNSHKLKHPETFSDCKLNVCPHCGVSYQSKASLDDHILKKHPEFEASVSSKIHACPNSNCSYKSTDSGNLVKHMLKHPENASKIKFTNCEHCSCSFRTKRALGDHIFRKHPEFSSSISGKIHECAYCAYKTTRKWFLDGHLLKTHPTSSENAAFTKYECEFCPFKTVYKRNLAVHTRKHREAKPSPQVFACKYCSAVYRRVDTFNEHVVKKHPDNVDTITIKLHECKMCSFKSIFKQKFTEHMSKKHNDSRMGKYQCKSCTYSATDRPWLEEHILKNHPELISSVVSKA
ncbi:unnamed protein product [Acanthoscelides obtectus]|uniref:C2H2-type domain-containing protein n=1 Tax=Acanthoscelides obtectus TaxID=200917 RepID=A0A9P0PKB6_ACAOB|nr:unnamed protein product [Acanthoscelides obtectus]CAK1626842.1 Zinc finger Y-chromosomal protein 1 [Acanthoscelides obtectus]